MENIIKQFLAISTRYNPGSIYGFYITDFAGSSYGSGYGSGYGNDRSGYGSGNGDGEGESWRGTGTGYGYGLGLGYSEGSHGWGYDNSLSGKGIKSYSGHEVYMVDAIQTIIYSIHGNIARGAIIRDDLTLSDCYIARYEDCFAHGKTAKQAMVDAKEKAYYCKPVEERINYVLKTYPDVDVSIEHSVLFSLHSLITGSCRFGRQEFAKAHSLDPEHGSMTMREFIHLTKDAFGGDNIRQLADAYGIKC